MREAETAKVLDACRGKGFASLRDEALIRLYANTGARLSEVIVDRPTEMQCPIKTNAVSNHQTRISM